MFGSIGMPELIIILVIALIIFGPRKLPELGKSLGRSLNEFKKASTDLQNTLEQEIKIEEQKDRRQGKAKRRPRRGLRYRPASDDKNTRQHRREKRCPRRRPVALVPFPTRIATTTSRTCRRSREGSRRLVTTRRAGGEGRMTFLEHLDELRKRITHAVGGLLVGFIIAFAFIDRVSDFIYSADEGHARRQVDLHRARREVHADDQDRALHRRPDRSPYIMLQVWLFIAPGLYAKEKKLAIPFVCHRRAVHRGAAFSHYSCSRRRGISSRSFSNEYIEFTPRVDPVFGMYVKLMLGIG
jgi:TatA/E family protein of Tat protein translocase